MTEDVSKLCEKDIKLKIEKEASIPFDVNDSSKLLIRAVMYKKDELTNYLLIVVHHLLSDGTTEELFTKELESYYNNDLAYPKDHYMYVEYATEENVQLNESLMKEQYDFWSDYLKDAPELIELPLDKKRPKVQKYVGNQEKFEITQELSNKISKFSKEKHVTPYVVYLSVFSILLSRYTRQDDLVIGTLVANRNSDKIQETMGYFANTILIRNQFQRELSFNQLIENERNNILDALSNAEYPIDKLVEKLSPVRDSSYNPLFQVLFVLQNFEMSKPNFSGLETTVSDVNNHTSKVDLNLTITPSITNAEAFIEYNTDLFVSKTIKKMVKSYLNLLENLVTSPSMNIYEIDMLSEEDKQNERYLSEKDQIEINVTKR